MSVEVVCPKASHLSRLRREIKGDIFPTTGLRAGGLYHRPGQVVSDVAHRNGLMQSPASNVLLPNYPNTRTGVHTHLRPEV